MDTGPRKQVAAPLLLLLLLLLLLAPRTWTPIGDGWWIVNGENGRKDVSRVEALPRRADGGGKDSGVISHGPHLEPAKKERGYAKWLLGKERAGRARVGQAVVHDTAESHALIRTKKGCASGRQSRSGGANQPIP